MVVPKGQSGLIPGELAHLPGQCFSSVLTRERLKPSVILEKPLFLYPRPSYSRNPMVTISIYRICLKQIKPRCQEVEKALLLKTIFLNLVCVHVCIQKCASHSTHVELRQPLVLLLAFHLTWNRVSLLSTAAPGLLAWDMLLHSALYFSVYLNSFSHGKHFACGAIFPALKHYFSVLFHFVLKSKKNSKILLTWLS